jgi:rare lipoprotein A
MPFINGKSYMNPAYGRAVERARANETVSSDNAARQSQGREAHEDENGHWVTIDGNHVLIQEGSAGRKSKPPQKPLPAFGQASIYADSFAGKKTANGETFDQNGYTAALLPRTRWHAVRLGTRVQLTHDDNSVVVEINDRGAGDKNPESPRTLDLSHAAASALTDREINDDDDAKKVGLIRLDKIKIVPPDTPLGPVPHSYLGRREYAQGFISRARGACVERDLHGKDRRRAGGPLGTFS